MRLSYYIILLLLFPMLATAQPPKQPVVEYIVEGGDTITVNYLPEAVVRPPRKFASKKEYRKYYRTVYNLKKVYPYAVVAKDKLAELDAQYLALPKKERKAYAKKIEKELYAQFEAPLKDLTRSQGKMLIKLINRETGETSYEIVKELKGGFNAFMWQSVAVLFGSSLKAKYDKYGDDEILEELVIMCEEGTFDNLYYSMYSK